MEVIEFQKRLETISSIAGSNDGVLKKEQVIEQFRDMDLNQAQMQKVIQYLCMKGIKIEGLEDGAIFEPVDEVQEVAEEKEVFPLTDEEEEFVKMFLSGCRASGLSEQELKEQAEGLLVRLIQGDSSVKVQLMENLLPIVVDIAIQENCEEMHISDLIQEANIGLLTALEEIEENVDHSWLVNRIREAVSQAIQAQTQQRFEDECLVSKVEKLESAVKELADDDEEVKFSVNELAIILDMDVEEIRGVLRLTGDD